MKSTVVAVMISRPARTAPGLRWRCSKRRCSPAKFLACASGLKMVGRSGVPAGSFARRSFRQSRCRDRFPSPINQAVGGGRSDFNEVEVVLFLESDYGLCQPAGILIVNRKMPPYRDGRAICHLPCDGGFQSFSLRRHPTAMLRLSSRCFVVPPQAAAAWMPAPSARPWPAPSQIRSARPPSGQAV